MNDDAGLKRGGQSSDVTQLGVAGWLPQVSLLLPEAAPLIFVRIRKYLAMHDKEREDDCISTAPCILVKKNIASRKKAHARLYTSLDEYNFIGSSS